MGHVVTYDGKKHAMTVSHGVNIKGDLLNDTWVLDMSGALGTWVCTHGDGPDCPQTDAVANASKSALQRPPPLAGAAYATSSGDFFVFGGLVSGPNDGKKVSDEFWTMSLSTDTWKEVRPDKVTSKHAFPIDVKADAYTKWNPLGAVNDKDFDSKVKPPARHQAAAAMIGPMAGMQSPLLIVGGSRTGPGESPSSRSLLDDMWIIDTVQAPGNNAVRNDMLGFDGIDDVIAIPLPEFVGASDLSSGTRAMNGMWLEAWIQQKRIDGTVVLWDAMTGDTVILRAMLMAVGGRQFARLVYYPGDAKQQIVKTWGPIMTEGFTSSWHHIAFVMRFAHVSRGSAADPDAILTQAFFFVDCEPQKDDGTFLLLDLRTLALSSGLDFIYVGGASVKAAILAREGYQNFHGNMDNIRIWWVPCPPGPTKCNPYGFLYPQQDYPPYKRMPASGIHDKDVTVDDVAPILRDSMFENTMPTNTTDLLVSIEVDIRGENGILIDSSTWLPADCERNKEASTACPGCPEACFFDDCWKFDADCFEPRLSEETVLFYAENGTCKCLDSIECPNYAEKCKCPNGYDRTCTKKDSSGACIEWGCVCGDRKATECSLCILNGNVQKPADPCLAPGTCRRSSCVFPFARLYDTKHSEGSATVEINEELETIEMTKFATDMVGRFLDLGLYDETKAHILNLMEVACYDYLWTWGDDSTDTNGITRRDDKRCDKPSEYADGWDSGGGNRIKCKCTFEDATTSEQASVRKKIDQYWKSGNDAWDRTSEALSRAPQMYNLTLALALVCKAGGCWEKKQGTRNVEDPTYCPKTKIDPAAFMDNLVGDKDKDNKLNEGEFLDQYKLLSRLKAVKWELNPMACTGSTSDCDAMCRQSSESDSSTCKCNTVKDSYGSEPWEGTCLFSNLEEDEWGWPKCQMSELLLPPAAFFMHLATNGAKNPVLDFVGAQRLFDIGLVTKLFADEYDPDGSGTIDMWELHCYYLEARDRQNSCYEKEAGAYGYGMGLGRCLSCHISSPVLDGVCAHRRSCVQPVMRAASVADLLHA